MSNKSGGSGCGWVLGLGALALALRSIGASAAVAVSKMGGTTDPDASAMALYLLIGAVVCYLLARGQQRR